MNRLSFNDNWKYRKLGDEHAPKEELKDVRLPFDAAWREDRDERQINGSKKGYFRNGKYEFTKIFSLSETSLNEEVYLEFEGVMSNASVYLNGTYLGFHPYGYTEFCFEIGRHLVRGNNYLQVLCSAGDDSRWYTGAGIYRSVSLLKGSKAGHFAVNGIRISTASVSEGCAVIAVKSEIVGDGNYEINYSVSCHGKTVGTFRTSEQSCGLRVENPLLWDDETPNLYSLKAELLLNGKVIDTVEERFGIRTIEASAQNGLFVNGKEKKLRGTCIHHDNGIAGAVSEKELELRKLRTLKNAGFNAVRIAHHPAGRYVLEACDELGIYVLNESFDQWHYSKSNEDYARYFDEWWRRDVKSLVDVSYNHPSVIIYSIGNEVSDCFNDAGAETGKMIADYLRGLDGTRLVTNAINGIMIVMKALEVYGMQTGQNLLGGGDVNDTMNAMRGRMKEFHTGETMERMLRNPASYLDVVGYNYMPERYELDEKKNPDRLIVGTESYPLEMNSIWSYVFTHKNVIGDFCWIGLDYIGEAGIGKITYEKGNLSAGIYGEYPYLTAGCGDIDINLNRLPASYYREIVFGLRKKPYVSVHRPRHDDKKPFYSLWSFDDVVSAWDFPEHEGGTVAIDVYSSSSSVSLYLNGKHVGTSDVREHKASFTVAYAAGSLKAVDAEGNEFELSTPENDYVLNVKTSGKEMRFIDVSVTDKNGRLHKNCETEAEIEITDGELLGFGNARSKTEATFLNNRCLTYEGRCSAIIRPGKNFKAVVRALGQEKEVC